LPPEPLEYYEIEDDTDHYVMAFIVSVVIVALLK
jgi:hypothetical protein